MKIVKVEISEKAAYLIPIGDLHIGDKGFNRKAEGKVKGYVDWVKERSNARVFLMGDILNNATRGSKTSPFEQTMTLGEQIEKAVEIFEPIKDKIIGALTGNHEFRLDDLCGYNPAISYCDRLGIPFLNNCAIIDFKVGEKARGSKKSNRVQYTIFSHHTNAGGGKRPGSKINSVDDLRQIVTNADAYLGAHNHGLAWHSDVRVEYTSQNGMVDRKQLLCATGGYLDYDDSYAERKALPKAKIGSLRIRLDGLKKDIHCGG